FLLALHLLLLLLNLGLHPLLLLERSEGLVDVLDSALRFGKLDLLGAAAAQEPLIVLLCLLELARIGALVVLIKEAEVVRDGTVLGVEIRRLLVPALGLIDTLLPTRRYPHADDGVDVVRLQLEHRLEGSLGLGIGARREANGADVQVRLDIARIELDSMLEL